MITKIFSHSEDLINNDYVILMEIGEKSLKSYIYKNL